jgi:cystathionine gamma-lyase
MKKANFETRAIHDGTVPDPVTGAVITPIYATSTYVQESPGIHKGFDYGRSHNLTRFSLEKCLASLEQGYAGFAFSSGMAAASTVLDTLQKDSHIIAIDDLYGGTYRLFERVKKITSGLAVTYLSPSELINLKEFIKPNTKMVWVETPTNPMLKLVDLEKVASEAKKFNLISVADNTFASPFVQQPLTLGFDIVLHSTTKYINGHSDVIGGAVVVREKGELAERVGFLQNAIGSIASPFDSFLTHRGLKTLGVRMKQHSSNAILVAEFLQSHPKIEKVIYPGLSSHPDYNLAAKQMKYSGGMISFVVKGGLESAKKFLQNLQIFSLAESLGGIESLIEHPAIMTHATIPLEQREKLGIVDGFIRVSVGIEDVNDLIDDINQALD